MNFLNQEPKNFRAPSARFFSIILWAPSFKAAPPSTLSWIRPWPQVPYSTSRHCEMPLRQADKRLLHCSVLLQVSTQLEQFELIVRTGKNSVKFLNQLLRIGPKAKWEISRE